MRRQGPKASPRGHSRAGPAALPPSAPVRCGVLDGAHGLDAAAAELRAPQRVEARGGHVHAHLLLQPRVVLELPANLNDLKREAQCGWITRQYRKLARVWHPDRYKGLKARGHPYSLDEVSGMIARAGRSAFPPGCTVGPVKRQ